MSPLLLLSSHVLPVSRRDGGWRVLERFCMRRLLLAESAPGEDALRGNSALTWDRNHGAFLHARLRHTV